MPAPDLIYQLIDLFNNNLETYRSQKYNETETRIEFIDKFFKELGWDVYNEKQRASAYKDVVREETLPVEGATKMPDYTFRIGGTRKFFVEAKKPAVKIETDIHPAFQLRRYAWSNKLPLSILTDFDELAVYDCRVRPNKDDKASTARVKLYKFTDYIDKWDEIAGIFSKEAIEKGAFDKYAEGMKGKKGTAEVDDAFLDEIEHWRELLARIIALRNPKLSVPELNYAVQMTIDRIIFLRICEDRGIEPEEQLRNAIKQQDVYGELSRLFRMADNRYNSGLFHFKDEKAIVSHPDELTLGLQIDNKPLQEILSHLYYPDCPYVFSEIPADILGQVYEQFLGKVVHLTPTHQARIEEKPEVRKAGGVYYTPTYIVDYIVKNTLGKLLEGKMPKEAAKIKVLDPACGSGTFLIGAYQYLLDWHLKWYMDNDPSNWAKRKNAAVIYRGDGDWQLTIGKKKEILLNNIFAVDIDSQAVEVAKLSLLLKVVESPGQLEFTGERILPDLGHNIQCGNSLIGHDYFEGRMLVDNEERIRVNAFDWRSAFPQVFAQGGFDAVIGNPPYVDIKSLPNDEVKYLFSAYLSANNRINRFALFVERSLTLVNPARFKFSMIIPTAFLTQDSYKQLRKQIIDKYQVCNIARIPNESFGSAAGNVKVDTAIIVVNAGMPAKVEVIAYAGYDRITEINPATAKVHSYVHQADWASNNDFIWSITTANRASAILGKIEAGAVPLENCAEFSLGVTPYDKYKGHTPAQIENQVFHAASKKDETYRKLLAGNDVRRYSIQWNGHKWISYGPWLGAPREKRFFTQKRILVKQIIDWTTKRIWASVTDAELYNTQNAFNLLPRTGWTAEYLLGVLNSRLMTYYHQKKFLDEFKMRFQKILIKDCKRFPIHPLNLSNPADRARQDNMVVLVKRMLELSKRKSSTPHEKEMLERESRDTDNQIDRLVYELYGLTEEEIKIVEGT